MSKDIIIPSPIIINADWLEKEMNKLSDEIDTLNANFLKLCEITDSIEWYIRHPEANPD